MAAVVFTEGPLAGERIALDREMTVGRADCDITLNDHQVSRRHLTLRPVDAELQVEDLGSRNGTFVNGRRITETVSAGDGDVIQLGTCELIVQLAGPADPVAVERASPTAPATVAAAPGAAALPGTAATGGLPRAFWIVTGIVEIAVILTAATLLVVYAVR